MLYQLSYAAITDYISQSKISKRPGKFPTKPGSHYHPFQVNNDVITDSAFGQTLIVFCTRTDFYFNISSTHLLEHVFDGGRDV